MMGRPTKYKEEYCKFALEFIGGQGKSIKQFCREIDVDTSTVHRWAKKHDKFRTALGRAVEHAEAVWQDKAEDYMLEKDLNTPLFKLIMENRFGWCSKTQHNFRAGGAEKETDTALIEKYEQAFQEDE